MSLINLNMCRAHNYRGFDSRGNLKKGKRFEGENVSPREAGRLCLEAMRAGRSRSTHICVDAGERNGLSFRTSIGIGSGGTPSWKVPATDEGVASLPEAIPQ